MPLDVALAQLNRPMFERSSASLLSIVLLPFQFMGAPLRQYRSKMKYMGSKRAMLHNGLGRLLAREMSSARRFVDLFAGSSAVATHVARAFDISVLAFDLQTYSVVLANAVLTRSTELNGGKEWESWWARATSRFQEIELPTAKKLTGTVVAEFRDWCRAQTNLPITQAYGGHYFSPQQACWIDVLRGSLPARRARDVALSALIQAASRCAAAPGHTAQPFQPTRSALPFLENAWRRDVVSTASSVFRTLAQQFARKPSRAAVSDANRAALQLNDGDLAFVDPPYSGVQYSRFYHVLETIARGTRCEVSGTGRYPPLELRPRSRYSLVSASTDALEELLARIASRGARVILTFPDHECSNGLSGESVREIAVDHFYIRTQHLDSNFSTMGGTSSNDDDVAGRDARHAAKELMLVLEPR